MPGQGATSASGEQPDPAGARAYQDPAAAPAYQDPAAAPEYPISAAAPGYGDPTGAPGYSTPPAGSAYPGPPTGAPTSRSSSMSGDQAKAALQNAHKFDLGIIACGLLAFIFSLFPFYSASVDSSGGPAGFDLGAYSNSGSESAWHGFFGWFAALVALAVAVLLLLKLLGMLPLAASMVRLAALAGFGLATLCLVLAFFVNPIPGDEGKTDLGGGVSIDYSKGVTVGFWLCLLAVLVGLALSVMRRDATD